MPLQATSGAASYDAFGGGAVAAIPYIEDVFSTYLYTGTGSARSINNEIDLSTKGGLVWTKSRGDAADHYLIDTVRGRSFPVSSNLDSAQDNFDTNGLSSFNTNGYSLGVYGYLNGNGRTFSSWTFREQPKFFDVVTWTGNGANRTIAHNLGSVPGCIIVKRTDATSSWSVYHRSLANTKYLTLNTTDDVSTDATTWNSTTATSTVFSLGTDTRVNASGGTYVAYVFAHDAGGFGLTGTDNVISCGSFNASGGVGSVNLGYEPQWLLFKQSNGFDDWLLFDNMRGMPTAQTEATLLRPNSTAAELAASGAYITPTATGFNFNYGGGGLFIYIAIRRGPMKVPTVGTSVFATALGLATTPNMVAGFPVDSFLGGDTNTATSTNWKWWDRLRSNVASLLTTTTAAEDTSEYDYGQFQSMTGFKSGNYDASDKIGWMFRRAPGFFDEVCYTGTGSSTTFSHNLAAVPELIIFKRRSAANPWMVYCNRYNGGVNANQYYQVLNATDTVNSGSGLLNNTDPTSSVFTVGTWNENNASGSTYVAYLFATCAGVSKVGSYTGNGSTQTIDCGFGAGGARFVVIKRTDSTGGWYVYDTARGMTVLTDPYLFLNTTDVQVATLGSVTTVSTGFALNSTILAAINVSAGTYIFLAIA